MRDIRSISERSNRKPNNIDLSMYTFGKIPPQATELEEAVLGAILIESKAIRQVCDVLTPECFYMPQHSAIYKACLTLFEKGEPVEILTVANQLRNTQLLESVGGIHYISSLTNKIGSTANLETHARIVKEKFIQRDIIRISGQAIKNAYEDQEDVFALLENVQYEFIELGKSGTKEQIKHVGTIVDETYKIIAEISKNKTGVIGLPSGIILLDLLLSGFQTGVYVLAARPGMGKSAFATSVIKHLSIDLSIPTGVITIEMSNVQQVKRLVSNVSNIDYKRLKTGNIFESELQDFNEAYKKIKSAPIYFDETADVNIITLRQKVMTMVVDFGVKFLVIDYLQLMSGSGKKGNREQEIAEISRAVKKMSKEFEVAILSLAQLSRNVETRGGSKTPQLSDLRESGAIEQDADCVMFINRPEYYGETQDEEGNSLLGVAKINIAKHRDGETKTIDCKFEGNFMRFSNLDSYTPIGSTLQAKIDQMGKKTEFPKGKEEDFEDF